MANTYTPPPTIDFSSINTSDLVYYNEQIPSGNFGTSSTSYSNISVYTPNSINIPIPGTYMVMVQTAVTQFSGTAGLGRALYRLHITKIGQTDIDTADEQLAIATPTVAFNVYHGTFVRKITFPVAGTWTLTPQWRTNDVSYTMSIFNNNLYPWNVYVFGSNAMQIVNQQLTQFVDSNYTLMTNINANAWWGNLTNATVAGYQTSITNNTNAIISNTSNIGALTTTVNNLSANVNNLQNSVSGLTSLSTISGGIRIKP